MADELDKQSTDLSLRPNPDTYVDRDRECEMLIKRIDASSTSVTGIAGVRGAGKSSLALKVLKHGDELGHFTLLVHSPTGYESREFLLAVFQSVCEETLRRLDLRFELLQSMKEKGHAVRRRLRRTALLILGACVLSFLLPLAFSYYAYWKDRASDSLARLMEQRDHLAAEYEAWRLEYDKPEFPTTLLKDTGFEIDPQIAAALLAMDLKRESLEAAKSDLEALRQSTAEPSRTVDELDEHTVTQLNSAMKRLGASTLLTDSDLSKVDAIIQEKEHELRLEEKLAEIVHTTENLRGYHQLFSDPLAFAGFGPRVGSTAALMVSGLIAYAGMIVAFLVFRRLLRRSRTISRFPAEAGFRSHTIAVLEHLRYQATVTRGSKSKIGVSKLSAEIARSRELQARPISLPGLTAEFRNYLSELSRLYQERVVICLDELDKIEKPEDLDKLLKGLKGVFGAEGTHFLLTVSEDAIARFATRKRVTRDIVESSLEDVIFLKRLDAGTATRLLCGVSGTGSTDHTSQFAANSRLLWLFGAGIPREIKRNYAICHQQGLLLADADPFDTWQTLYANLLDSVCSWVLLVGNDDSDSYKCLRILEETRANTVSRRMSSDAAIDWLDRCLALWPSLCPASASGEEANGRPEICSSDGFGGVEYQRAELEVCIAALGILLAIPDPAIEQQAIVDKMAEVLEQLSTNLRFSREKLLRVLRHHGACKGVDASRAC